MAGGRMYRGRLHWILCRAIRWHERARPRIVPCLQSMEHQMKLYSFSGSCGLAANVVLAWIDQPYTVELIAKDDLAKPEMRQLNPVGKVPILEDDGRVLYENAS